MEEWGLPERLDPLPEGEISAGGVREMLGVPGPAAPDQGDAGRSQGGLDGECFDQPRTNERTISDDPLELMLPGPVHDRYGEG